MNIFAQTVFAKIDAQVFGNAVNPIMTHLVNPVVQLMFAVAVVVFVFGVCQVVWGGEEARTAGKNSMIGGIIGMFIMLSAWGIIYLIANTVGSFGK